MLEFLESLDFLEVLDGLNGHGVCATALVEGGIEILPLFLHHLVVLKLVTAFGPFVATVFAPSRCAQARDCFRPICSLT